MRARPVLREQVAFAPSPSQSARDEKTPSWMSKLDTMGNRSNSRSLVNGQSPTPPPKVENPPSNATPAFSPPDSRLLQQELHSTVWEDAETTDLVAPAEQQNEDAGLTQNEQREEEGRADDEVEELPTVPMPSTFAPEKAQKPSSPPARQDQPASMNGQQNAEDRADADLPTRPLAVNLPLPKPPQAHRSTERPFPAQSYRQSMSPQSPRNQAVDQQRQGFSAQAEPSQLPIVQRPVTPALPISYPGFQQATPAPASTGSAASPAPSRPARRRSKMRVVVVLSMLLILVVGGLIYWIMAYQPFSVPAVTQTSLSFRDTNLGIALHYPQGWTAKPDAAHQTASFFDANHTDQVNIFVTASNGQSIAAYVKKEVAQLGLTAQKTLSPLTFAGVGWQQTQGTVLVSGATYTETLLVAARGDSFYAITQMAPAATYSDADHLFFAMLRASFQFL